jgi:hypothetical protein
MKNTLLRFLFIIFIGVLTALFTGVTIDTFYAPPKSPEYKCASPKMAPSEIRKDGPTQAELDEMEKCNLEMNDLSEKYRAARKIYSRNVAAIAIVAAALIVLAGLFLFYKMEILADGLLLGGIGSLIYGLIHSFQSDQSMVRFVSTTVSLAIVIAAGYFRFIFIKEK